MGFVYAIANQKGGVGKTTTTVNIAACIAETGRQTLVVDLDPQCNATVTLGLDREARPSTYDTLCGDVSIAEAARPTDSDNLWVVPANRDLAGASVELPGLDRSEYRLREGLGPIRERFAATFLDCPPSLGPITVNGYQAVIAGHVARVGAGVTAFQPGDEVFGGRSGSFAEYVVAKADRAIVRKPANVTFEEAAAVPVAGSVPAAGSSAAISSAAASAVVAGVSAAVVAASLGALAASSSPPPQPAASAAMPATRTATDSAVRKRTLDVR